MYYDPLASRQPDDDCDGVFPPADGSGTGNGGNNDTTKPSPEYPTSPNPTPPPRPNPPTTPVPPVENPPSDTIDPNLLSLAMGFVPYQSWEKPYANDVALSRGTIFPSLDKPYLGEPPISNQQPLRWGGQIND